MSLKRLFLSWAWTLMPYANCYIRLPSRLKIPITLRGDTKFISDLFIGKEYTPFLAPLKDIKSWVDLGSNSGIVSLALYENLNDKTHAKAVLVDAGKRCIKAVQRIIDENQLQEKFFPLRALVGPAGATMQFNEVKHALTSSAVIVSRKEDVNQMQCVSVEEILARYNLSKGADLLKVDIEGSEKYLIPDQGDVFDRFQFTWLEYHKPHLVTDTILKFVQNKGYRILAHQDSEDSGMILWQKI